jgi:hypothetical protein
MENERSSFAVMAAMLGVDAGVLRAVAAPWIQNERTPPITTVEFEKRLAEAQGTADGLNNTNLWEHAIREAMEQADLPLELPSTGVPRLVVHEGGKRESEDEKHD